MKDQARALGDPDVENVIRVARVLEYVLGADDYAETGLPVYHRIDLRREP